ncbi:hypothetical protein CF651_09095 [Paenibacillus rigui]|uniref:Uncharacterized protein n=1 Tax=Paenibacillus rigui TaxID=554312 RepID=A0A229UUK6_9BACL|nr:hypothetical protein CF651_09095 [Paenibacillus rigui]
MRWSCKACWFGSNLLLIHNVIHNEKQKATEPALKRQRWLFQLLQTTISAGIVSFAEQDVFIAENSRKNTNFDMDKEIEISYCEDKQMMNTNS